MSVASCTNLDIINAQLPGSQGRYCLRIDAHGIIQSIQPMDHGMEAMDEWPVLDVAGDWVSLGGVDLQINGALGLAFPDVEISDRRLQQGIEPLPPVNQQSHLEKLTKICSFLWEQGIDGFVPTIVTTSVEKIQRAIATFAQFMAQPTPPHSAKILGVHLEGPFLNPDKRGAHPAEYLLPQTLENVKQVLGDYASVVKIITLAPELDQTGEVIPYLRSQGIVVSLGHSMATAEQAQRAFEQGATMVTHAFNAMPSLHHRQPGLLGAAMVHPAVQCGLIADGQHVCITMIDLLLRASHYAKGVFLVSDALAPLGLPDGLYPWDNRQISVKNGTAQLLDGTLAGTTLPLFTGVQNLVKWGICEVGEAIALATDAPRRAIGLSGISVGQSANLLRWHLDQTTATLTPERLLPSS